MNDVEEVLDTLGIVVTGTSHSGRTGNLHYHARCPYHYAGKEQDFTPSWDINAETGAHHCHSCGFSGSLEWLIHKVSGVTMVEASTISNKGGRALERVKRINPWGGERPIPLPPMNEARIKMYGRPPEWAMDTRRLDQDAVEEYDIRWAAPFLHGKDRVEYDNCWITAIREPLTFTAIGMQVKQETGVRGDRFFRNLPAAVAKGSTLFGIDAVTPGGSVIVVESPLDAAYLYRLGYKAVSSMGAKVSHDQMELLIANWDEIVLAQDNDDAGWQSMYRLIGLNMAGRYNPQVQDYSKRVPIRVPNYEGFLTKDVGEMSPSIAREFISSTVPAFRLQMRTLV